MSGRLRAAARVLERFARKPYRSCWLLEGPGGTGKTASACALAEELGCTDLSRHVISASKLDSETAEELFGRTCRFLPMDKAAFHVVIIEEFEKVVSQEVKTYLKTALDWSVDALRRGLPAGTGGPVETDGGSRHATPRDLLATETNGPRPTRPLETQREELMRKMSEGEKQFNWWIWRFVIVAVLIALFCRSKPAKLPDQPVRTAHRSVRR